MKNKTLKHYKRKKFFYRFFMRKSPRSGAMFGLAWMICFGAILPLALWLFLQMVPQAKYDFNTVDIILLPTAAVLFFKVCLLIYAYGVLTFAKLPLAPWLFLQMVPLAKYDFNTADIILLLTAAVLFFTVCLLIYAYGVLTFAKNFYAILRNDLKKSRFWKFPAFISAVWYGLARILLLSIVIKKKRWAGLLFILLSFVFGFLGNMLDTPLQKWWCFHFGVAFMLFCAIGVIGKKGDFQRKAVYPLFGFGLFGIVLLASDFYLFLQIDKRQSELAQVTQCGIGAADWQKRNESGYSINKEPLKSFCKVDIKIDMEKYQTPEEAKRYLAELRKTQADNFVAIDRLLELKPQRISYNWVEPGEPVAGMLLPDLQGFRTAACLCNLEILANVKDKALVAKCNQDMLKFREWCFYNETWIGKLVAENVDNLRLYALSYAMASGVYSKDEIIKLIGDAPDWSKQYSGTFASEHAMLEEFVNRLENASAEDIQSLEIPSSTKTFWKFYQKFAPLFVKMNIKRDYLFTLNYYLKINSLLYRDDLSGLEKKKMAYLNYDSLCAEHFIASQVVIPALSEVLARIDRVHQMALLAAEVMEYRKQHGKLPEDLSFLPQIPLSKLDHKPLMYEKTKNGFRIFSHTNEGEKPDEEDTRFSYWVRLDEKNKNL